MLARLQEEGGVSTAEVDRRGELLRLHLGSPSDVVGVIDRLQALGFIGEAIPDADIDAPRWYGLDDVGELSREEARVIARRVVPVFARQTNIEAGEIHGLNDLVANALHACFISHTIDATAPHDALNTACGRTVEDATRLRLGANRAAALGQAIEADLATRSAFKE